MSDNVARPKVFSTMPSREDALDAVRTLLRWTGDDPDREGLVDTPSRVLKAYNEFYAGYAIDAEAELARTFEEIEGYDEMVMLTGISFESHCEHHMVPILGTAHVAYMPKSRVVGISKLARVVDAFAKRLQSQETMTMQIADAIENALDPAGVAIVLDAEHMCMTTRGIRKAGAKTRTQQLRGVFKSDPAQRAEFIASIPA